MASTKNGEYKGVKSDEEVFIDVEKNGAQEVLSQRRNT